MNRAEWLAAYHKLDERREALSKLYQQAELNPGLYYEADPMSTDINEELADLADHAADILAGDQPPDELDESAWGVDRDKYPCGVDPSGKS